MAKNDIREVVTGQLLADAIDTLQLDGAQCQSAGSGHQEVCVYDEHTNMTLYYANQAPAFVEKIVYCFSFNDMTKIRQRLQELYGLKKDRIEGEHKLFTGERLLIDLDEDGTGSLSIINDHQIAADRTKIP